MVIHPGLNYIILVRRLLGRLENALNPLLYLSGSISTLNEGTIKEAADGLLTVKRWAFDVLYNLNPSKNELQGEFLTNLYKAFTLGRLRKDGRTVDDCLCRMPSAFSWKQRHPRLITFTHPALKYTLYATFCVSSTVQATWHKASDFLGMSTKSPKLQFGDSDYDRYLVRERLPVDLAVLCSIVERLFGLAVMTEKCRGNLDGVLLPRSWILMLWKDFITFKDRAWEPLWVLAQSTESLLKDVYTGEYLRRTIKDFESVGKFR